MVATSQFALPHHEVEGPLIRFRPLRSSRPLSAPTSRAARRRGCLGRRRLIGDRFGAHRRHPHFAEPGADIGGQAGIGSDRREFSGLPVADLDAGIGHQPVGGGDHVAGRSEVSSVRSTGARPAGRGRCRCSRRAAPCDRRRRFRCRHSARRWRRWRRRWCCRRKPWSGLPDKTPGTSAPARRCRAQREIAAVAAAHAERPGPPADGRRPRRRRGRLVVAERIGEEVRLRRGRRCCFCSRRKTNRTGPRRTPRGRRNGAPQVRRGNKHHAAPHAPK